VSATVRNVLILLALAVVVAFVPGGGDTAAFISAVLSIAILASFVLLGGRYYREHRVTIFSLGDRHRALLYGAIGLIVVALAGRTKLLHTGPGTLAWFVMLGGAAAALYAVWRHYRAYSY
jgi:Kef-type K+ transport system membrane component KefB